MINSVKKVNELGLKLRNSNINAVVTAIDSLRDEAPFSGAIDLLADLYDRSDSELVKETIKNFLNDLKDLSGRQEVIDQINKPFKAETLTMLVSSCWQSGLDYSEWVNDLAVIFCRSDYATALECFTVIEETSQNLSDRNKNEVISILNNKANKISGEKSALHRNLLATLM